MSRRCCSCCGVAGHIVSACNDEHSNALMVQLFQAESVAVAMQKVKAMTAGVVSFVLSRGFNVAISGKRARLIELVLARYPAPDALEYRESVATREAVAEVKLSRARIVARERAIVARDRAIEERERMNSLLRVQEEQYSVQVMFESIVALIHQFDYTGAMSLLPSHESYGEPVYVFSPHQIVQTMLNFVVNFLTTVYRLETDKAGGIPVLTRQLEINRSMRAKLNSSEWFESALRCAALSSHVEFTQAGIVHMTCMAKMYNYRRMLQADQTLFVYSPINAPFLQPLQPVVHKMPMKPLNIRVVLVVEDDVEEVVEEGAPKKELPVCGICFDDLLAHKAVITGCNHTFCSDCIGKFARTRGIKSFINCPCCRREVDELMVTSQVERVAVIAGLAPVPI